ncbi:hypothetical protein FS837_000667 [Tulasnella sp. UAMH 9824]|nr:hypothetical protein FS837_000667 [Tulasnella sp. UAMH 9824]
MVPLNSNFPNAATAPYLGLVAWGDWTVKSGSGPGFAYMANTIQTSAGSTPVAGQNSWIPESAGLAKVESAVWTVDVSTWSLTLKWVNPDGSLSGGLPFTEDNAILFGYRDYKASTDPSWNPERINISFKFVPDGSPL